MSSQQQGKGGASAAEIAAQQEHAPPPSTLEESKVASLIDLLGQVGGGLPLWMHLEGSSGNSITIARPGGPPPSKAALRATCHALRSMSDLLITTVDDLRLGWTWDDALAQAEQEGVHPSDIVFSEGEQGEGDEGGAGGKAKGKRKAKGNGKSEAVAWPACQRQQQDRLTRFLQKLMRLASVQLHLGPGGAYRVRNSG